MYPLPIKIFHEKNIVIVTHEIYVSETTKNQYFHFYAIDV